MMEPVISTSIPIADGLFVDADTPALIGGKHRTSGRIVFPCPAGNADYDPVVLPARGTLWSWTIQRYRPKTPPYAGPEAFEPFALGYVELPGAVIVEGPLRGVDFDKIRIGMEMETVLWPYTTDAQGRSVVTYAFAPVAKEDDA